MIRRLALWAALLLPFSAQALEYGLKPVKVAPDTYVFEGKRENFSSANGGNIVNTGFIVTKTGVVVVDTGPSRLYGLEMLKAIAQVTPLPVIRVFNTHLHPDHVFGNQAYAELPIEALPETKAELATDAKGFSDNMYRLVGPWMQGTEPVLPSKEIAPRSEVIGEHRLVLMGLKGHSGGDLVVFDHKTGVLFAADLAFLDRAPTTPHADIAAWLSSLDFLATLPVKVLVPGHGPMDRSGRALAQTRDWLVWLRGTLTKAAAQGLDMTEVLALPIPERFAGLALARQEFTRSVSHLYPKLELAALEGAKK